MGIPKDCTDLVDVLTYAVLLSAVLRRELAHSVGWARREHDSVLKREQFVSNEEPAKIILI